MSEAPNEAMTHDRPEPIPGPSAVIDNDEIVEADDQGPVADLSGLIEEKAGA